MKKLILVYFLLTALANTAHGQSCSSVETDKSMLSDINIDNEFSVIFEKLQINQESVNDFIGMRNSRIEGFRNGTVKPICDGTAGVVLNLGGAKDYHREARLLGVNSKRSLIWLPNYHLIDAQLKGVRTPSTGGTFPHITIGSWNGGVAKFNPVKNKNSFDVDLYLVCEIAFNVNSSVLTRITVDVESKKPKVSKFEGVMKLDSVYSKSQVGRFLRETFPSLKNVLGSWKAVAKRGDKYYEITINPRNRKEDQEQRAIEGEIITETSLFVRVSDHSDIVANRKSRIASCEQLHNSGGNKTPNFK